MKSSAAPSIRSRLPAPPPPSVHDSTPLPKRAVIAVAGTILGLALLLSFKTPDAIPSVAGGLRATPPVAAPTQPLTAVGGPTPLPSAVPLPTTPRQSSGSRGIPAPTVPAAGGRGAPSSPSPVTPAQPIPAPATPQPTAAPKGPTGDAVGPVERTPFGDVQVEVKASGGQIVDVIALVLPNDRRRSAQISQYVGPILHDEALQAQSAQIDLISGATWTSGAYQASLQGALDKLGAG